MKNESSLRNKRQENDELRTDYSFDYAKAKPNRFARPARSGAVAVLLDPDVAEVFKDAQSVNTVLRTLLKVLPPRRVIATRQVRAG